MLTKWRSLVVTGVMLSALVLFGPAAAQAQTALSAPASVASVVQVGYDSLLVTWTASSDQTNADGDPVKEYEVGWIKTSSAAVFGAASPMTQKANKSQTQSVITGLDADTSYLVGVRALPSDTAANSTSPWAYATTPRTTTGPAPVPEVIRDRDIEIAEGDEELTVEWDEPDAGGSGLEITEYFVEWAEKKDGTGKRRWPHMLTDRVLTIDRLANGTMYYVAVGSKNSAGGMREPSFAEAASGTPMAPPAPELTAPKNVMLEAGDGMIMASWDAVEHADSYKVAWTAGGVTSSAMATGMSYTIENLMNGTQYSVQISAMMGDMEGPASTAMMATPMPADPVPALPLFGMLALGAGLVAAGRRRLHAQRLLNN